MKSYQIKFPQGVGKGVVGLVARPTGGIIDFASGTFDSVKRVTEVIAEVNRVRPPRFLKQVKCSRLKNILSQKLKIFEKQDGVVRYYNRKEALGCRLLIQLDKGRYAETDVYITHQDIEADKESVFMVTKVTFFILLDYAFLIDFVI